MLEFRVDRRLPVLTKRIRRVTLAMRVMVVSLRLRSCPLRYYGSNRARKRSGEVGNRTSTSLRKLVMYLLVSVSVMAMVNPVVVDEEILRGESWDMKSKAPLGCDTVMLAGQAGEICMCLGGKMAREDEYTTHGEVCG